MPNDATKQDIIDVIDFSKTSLAKPEYLRDIIKNFSTRHPYGDFFNIANHLILTYFCKHHIKTPADIGILVVPLLERRDGGFEPFQNYMSDDEKRIVFKSFNVDNLVDMMNMIETNPDVLNAVVGDRRAAERFQRVFERFSQHDLDLFLSETGADKFVNFIKIRQAKRREELEKEKKEEAEREKRQREIEAEREKRQREKEEQEAEREKKFNAVVSKRLQKLAANLDKGVFKYTMRTPFNGEITSAHISRLPHDDPGVLAMFNALVKAQTKITTPEELKGFNDLLQYMSGQFKPKTCLYHTSVVDMMAAAGVKNFNDKDKKPFKTQEAIARYRHILWVLRRYPTVFGVDGFDVAKDFTDNPHSKSVNIFDYDNDKELQKLEAKAQFDKEKGYIMYESDHTKKREIFKRVGLAIRTVKNKKNYKNTLKEINDRSK